MKTININKRTGANFFTYPDGQPHIIVDDYELGDEIKVICSMTDCQKIIELLMISDALENIRAKKSHLVIPYLMGARYDRSMMYGDSIDLKVIAKLINSCGFEEVSLIDVHSDSALLLIENSFNFDNSFLVKEYDTSDSILICPDAGAAKKVDKYLEWNKNLVDIVYCTKTRDLSNGNLTIKVLEPEKCKDRNCVIIDDLCDGGGTFLGIASQIKPRNLELIVTHGIFSKGYKALMTHFNRIVTSNSYPHKSYPRIMTKEIK